MQIKAIRQHSRNLYKSQQPTKFATSFVCWFFFLLPIHSLLLQILKDKQKRAQYDSMKQAGFNPPSWGQDSPPRGHQTWGRPPPPGSGPYGSNPFQGSARPHEEFMRWYSSTFEDIMKEMRDFEQVPQTFSFLSTKFRIKLCLWSNYSEEEEVSLDEIQMDFHIQYSLENGQQGGKGRMTPASVRVTNLPTLAVYSAEFYKELQGKELNLQWTDCLRCFPILCTCVGQSM